MERLILAAVAVGALFLGSACFADDAATPAVVKQEPSKGIPSFAEFDKKATEGAKLNVVFFGGSLTYGANASDPSRTSWRGLTGEYLRSKYPKSSFMFYDAAIGGTGSKLGLFRLQRDVLERKPDLVFLEFSVNDTLDWTEPVGLGTYEALMREMISRGILVEQVITCFKDHVGDPNLNPEKYGRYKAHMQLSKAYGTAVGDCLMSTNKAVTTGGVAKDKVWPWDGAHPDDIGYQFFFEGVRDGFESAVKDGRICAVPKAPVFPGRQFNKINRIRLADLPEAPKGWHRAKTSRTSAFFDGMACRWMDDTLSYDFKAAEPTTLKVEFEGTFVGIFGDADPSTVDIKVAIDGKPLMHGKGDKASDVWAINTKMLGGKLMRFTELATDLPQGKHTIEITPVLSAENKSPVLKIESVCAAGE